jgi:phosphatidate phosphatase LPIN
LGQFLVQSDEEPLSSSDEREERPQQPSKVYAPTTQGRWSRWFGRSRSGRETPVGATTTPPVDGPGDRPVRHAIASAPMTVAPTGAPPSRAASPDPANPTPTAQPTSGPAASAATKHYVKTLRLTSDQLVSPEKVRRNSCLNQFLERAQFEEGTKFYHIFPLCYWCGYLHRSNLCLGCCRPNCHL